MVTLPAWSLTLVNRDPSRKHRMPQPPRTPRSAGSRRSCQSCRTKGRCQRKTPAPPLQAGRGKFVWDLSRDGPEGSFSGPASACKDVHALWLTRSFPSPARVAVNDCLIGKIRKKAHRRKIANVRSTAVARLTVGVAREMNTDHLSVASAKCVWHNARRAREYHIRTDRRSVEVVTPGGIVVGHHHKSRCVLEDAVFCPFLRSNAKTSTAVRSL
jgi:hypothetical protein